MGVFIDPLGPQLTLLLIMCDNIFDVCFKNSSPIDILVKLSLNHWVSVFIDEVVVERVHVGGIERHLAAKEVTQIELGYD
jgi:hypothetical protein